MAVLDISSYGYIRYIIVILFILNVYIKCSHGLLNKFYHLIVLYVVNGYM